MNFLAHAFLSGNDRDVLFGNFVADSIKGKAVENYSFNVRQGVSFHRFIDAYTDSHAAVRQSNEKLQPVFHKYSGVVTDIFFDHFLAIHWSNYNSIPLSDFASYVYQILLERYVILPPRSRRILPWMMAQNWLVGYANLSDLNRVFRGMSRRTVFDSNMERAVDFLCENYVFFEQRFQLFLPELIHASNEFKLLHSISSQTIYDNFNTPLKGIFKII